MSIRTNRVAAAILLVDFPEARDRRLVAAEENILELTTGNAAMEIDFDTKEDLCLLHGIRSTRD